MHAGIVPVLCTVSAVWRPIHTGARLTHPRAALGPPGAISDHMPHLCPLAHSCHPTHRRATHYGTDGWSIHKGSCGYGQLAEDVGTGWDIAALSDSVGDYKGSCG